jgi:hypothetical protein
MFLALVAGATGVLICLWQHHFTLQWSAASVAVIFRHRCGLVMVAALVWVLLEVAVQV